MSVGVLMLVSVGVLSGHPCVLVSVGVLFERLNMFKVYLVSVGVLLER